MGRLAKTALLVLLLTLSGVPGVALQLCAKSAGAQAHACCMGHQNQNHQQMSDSVGGGSTAQAKTASCCKVAPAPSVPPQAAWPSTGSRDVANAPQATSGFLLSVPPTRVDRGTPHLARALKPPAPAMLCTFLI